MVKTSGKHNPDVCKELGELFLSQCLECNPKACDKCQKHRASYIWTGQEGTLAWSHGFYQNYCKCCALQEQVAYAEAAAARLQKLRKELKTVKCSNASAEDAEKARKRNTYIDIKYKCDKCGRGLISSHLESEPELPFNNNKCTEELNPPRTEGQVRTTRIIKPEEMCGGQMVEVSRKERLTR